MITIPLRVVLSVAMVLSVAACGLAEVKPHGMFTENAVLQRDMDVPVWGRADEGETVTVEIHGQKVSATTKGGQWKVVLKPLSVGGPYEMKISGDKNPDKAIVFKNVLVGDVFLISGQSNMAFGLSDCDGGPEAREKSEDPMFRVFWMPWHSSYEPEHDIQQGERANWMPGMNPYYAHMTSGVGYFMARDLRKAHPEVPIGLISSCVGGSFVHVWIPSKYVEADPEFKPLLEWYPRILSDYQKLLAEYKAKEPELQKQYEEALAKAKAEGKPEPQKPQPPQDPETDTRMRPSGLYNAMISPIQPYAIRAACWYQGENDAGLARRYQKLLSLMIQSWRETWGQDFPVFIVQLPAYYKIVEEPVDSEWAELRETQLKTTQTVPKTALVVAIDCGDDANTTNLHPGKKQPIGERLALAIRNVALGEKVEYSGPIFESMKIDGDKATISYTHIGGGLVSKDGKPLKGFAIAGEDKKFYNASAEIVGETVVVKSDRVSKPVHVRYAWADYPVVNLYNKDGIPAAPFRTDDFPMKSGPR